MILLLAAILIIGLSVMFVKDIFKDPGQSLFSKLFKQ